MRWARRLLKLAFSPPAGLGFFSLMAIVRGWSYLPFTDGPRVLPSGLEELKGDGTISTFGWMWVAAGVAGFVSACVLAWAPKLGWHVWVGWVLLMAIYSTWTYAYVRGWITDDFASRDYLNIAGYAGQLYLLGTWFPEIVKGRRAKGQVIV